MDILSRKQKICICETNISTTTQVIDSRTSRDGKIIRRRRLCLDCKNRFTTWERREHPTETDAQIQLFSVFLENILKFWNDAQPDLSKMSPILEGLQEIVRKQMKPKQPEQFESAKDYG